MLIAIGAGLVLLADNVRLFDEPGGATFASYAFDTQYRTSVGGELLRKTPTWGRFAENPPLSAKDALRAADKMKDELVEDTDKYEWHLRSLDLTPGGGRWWYWMAHYQARPRQGVGSSEIHHELKLAVLMDGTAVKPEVNPW
jgi:hypothetical protein